MSDCLNCREEIVEELDFSHLGEILICPYCGHKHAVEYEESYDESGETWGWMWLIEA